MLKLKELSSVCSGEHGDLSNEVLVELESVGVEADEELADEEEEDVVAEVALLRLDELPGLEVNLLPLLLGKGSLFNKKISKS